jgi:hypothetical protein
MRGNLCVVLHGRELRVRQLRVRQLRLRQLRLRHLYCLNGCRLHGRKKPPQVADVKQRKPVNISAVVTLDAIKLENPNPILGLHVHGLPLAHIKREIPFIKLTHHQIHPQIRG